MSVALKYLKNLTLLALIAVCFSCGGGTTGTGDYDSVNRSTKVIDAKINYIDNSPASEVHLSVLNTGDSGLTDSDGLAMFETKTDEKEIELLIEKDTLSTKIILNDIPEGDAILSLDLTIDLNTEVVTLVTIMIEEITDNEVPDSEMPDDEVIEPEKPAPTEPEPVPEPEPSTPTPHRIDVQIFYSDRVPVENARIKVTKNGAKRTNSLGKASFKVPRSGEKVSVSFSFEDWRGGDIVFRLPKNKAYFYQVEYQLGIPSTWDSPRNPLDNQEQVVYATGDETVYTSKPIRRRPRNIQE